MMMTLQELAKGGRLLWSEDEILSLPFRARRTRDGGVVVKVKDSAVTTTIVYRPGPETDRILALCLTRNIEVKQGR